MSSIAFTPDELVDAKKEFRGIIIGAEYSKEPFGIAGSPDIVAKEKLGIKIDTEVYDKPQYEWFTPSIRKLTKWAYLVEALANVGAMADMEVKGTTEDERMESFADGLIGMAFDFVEFGDLEMVVKGRKLECILPVAYHGKKEIKPIQEIREEKVEL